MNEDRHDSLDPERQDGFEEAGVWIRDTLRRRGGGFYHLGYSPAHPASWGSLEDLEKDAHRDDFTLVAEGLLAHARGQQGLVVLVADNQAQGRARCFLAFQIARVLAEGGARVLLVDGEFEEDGPGEWLGTPGHEGFLDIARYGASPRTALQRTDIPNLELLGVGSYRPHDSEPLTGEELRGALRQLRAGWNLVLMTAPARSETGELNPIFSFGDGILMGLTLWGEARDRFEALAEDIMGREVPIFGVMAFDEPGVAAPAPPPPEVAEVAEGREEWRAPSGSTSPYASPVRQQESSPLFRRLTLVIALALIVFVGLWLGIQWMQGRRASSQRYTTRLESPPPSREAEPTAATPQAAGDSTRQQMAASDTLIAESARPESTKSAILAGGGEVKPPTRERPGVEELAAKVATPGREESSKEPEDSLMRALKLRPENGYALHPWSFADSAQALPSVRKLRAEGFQPVVVSAKIPGKGTWYRVILGNYATRSQALEARKLLLSRRDVDYVGVLKVGH